MTNIKCGYLDMDDVLLMTTDYAFKYHGVESPFSNPENCGTRNVHSSVGMTWETFWHDLPQEFWESIPKMDWCDDIVREFESYFGDDVYLLTSPIPNGVCSAGKQIWVNNFMPKYKAKLITAHKKYACVGTDGILLDDSYKNENKFNKAGKAGNFYLFPSYQNRLWPIMGSLLKNPRLAVDMVSSKLESLV